MRSLTLGAATALSLALAAAPAPTEASPPSTAGRPSVQLSATGDPAWDAEVAYSADGSAVIAWGRFDGTRYVAEAVRREGGRHARHGPDGRHDPTRRSIGPRWGSRTTATRSWPGRAGTASTTASRRAGIFAGGRARQPGDAVGRRSRRDRARAGGQPGWSRGDRVAALRRRRLPRRGDGRWRRRTSLAPGASSTSPTMGQEARRGGRRDRRRRQFHLRLGPLTTRWTR